MTAWTREAVEALGPTTNVPTTAAILGVDPDTVYGAIRRGEWTATRILRIGRSIKVPVLDLIRLLYAPEASAAAVPPVAGTEHHCASTPKNTWSSATESQPQCGCKVEPSGAVLPLRAAQ